MRKDEEQMRNTPSPLLEDEVYTHTPATPATPYIPSDYYDVIQAKTPGSALAESDINISTNSNNFAVNLTEFFSLPPNLLFLIILFNFVKMSFLKNGEDFRWHKGK